MPRVIQVIESEVTRGKGHDRDPVRSVMQYYATDGTFLAERDTWPVDTQPGVPDQEPARG